MERISKRPGRLGRRGVALALTVSGVSVLAPAVTQAQTVEQSAPQDRAAPAPEICMFARPLRGSVECQDISVQHRTTDNPTKTIEQIHEFMEHHLAEEAHHKRQVAERRRAEQQSAGMPAPSPTDTGAAPASAGGYPPAADFVRLAQCESGGNWAADTGNGFYGGVQFTQQSWDAVGGQQFAALPSEATEAEQIEAAQKLWQLQGWNAWPVCSVQQGLTE